MNNKLVRAKLVIALFGLILMLGMLAGCSEKEESTNVTQSLTEQTTENNYAETTEAIDTEATAMEIEENDMKADLGYLSNVSYIKICDPVDNKFVESIDKKLEDSDVEALKAIATDITCSEREGNISTEYYALKFYDANDNEVAVWKVGTRYTVEDSTGQVLSREKELKPWISSIEEKYEISYEILNRTPGVNYFYQLDKSASIVVQEIVDKPTVEDSGKSVKLTEDEVQGLCACMGKVSLKAAESDVQDYCLNISVSSKAGGGLYEFWVKPDGRVFVRATSAYEVCGDEIIAWVRQIEQTYELRTN